MAHPVETIQCSVTKTKKHIVHVLFTNITIHKLKRKLTKSASKLFKKKIKESHVLLLKGSHKVILQYIIVVFQPTRMLNIEKFILILCLVKQCFMFRQNVSIWSFGNSEIFSSLPTCFQNMNNFEWTARLFLGQQMSKKKNIIQNKNKNKTKKSKTGKENLQLSLLLLSHSSVSFLHMQWARFPWQVKNPSSLN